MSNTVIIKPGEYDKELFKFDRSNFQNVEFETDKGKISYLQGCLSYDGKIPVVLVEGIQTFGLQPQNVFSKVGGVQKAEKVSKEVALQTKGHKWNISLKLAETTDEKQFGEEAKKIFNFFSREIPEIIANLLVQPENIDLLSEISCLRNSYNSIVEEAKVDFEEKNDDNLPEEEFITNFLKKNFKRVIKSMYKSKVSRKVDKKTGKFDPNSGTYMNINVGTRWDESSKMTQFNTNFYISDEEKVKEMFGEDEAGKTIQLNPSEVMKLGSFKCSCVIPMNKLYLGSLCMSWMMTVSELNITKVVASSNFVTTSVFGTPKPMMISKEVSFTEDEEPKIEEKHTMTYFED